jgi:hypothetical protein
MLWLGEEITVEPPYWIFVYTGPGQRRFTTTEGSKEPALVLHWGKPQTLLGYPMIAPTLFRIGGILRPSSPSLADLLGTLMPPTRGAPTSEGTLPGESSPPSFKLLLEALKAEQEKK